MNINVDTVPELYTQGNLRPQSSAQNVWHPEIQESTAHSPALSVALDFIRRTPVNATNNQTHLQNIQQLQNLTI